jgi:hypothetical protein
MMPTTAETKQDIFDRVRDSADVIKSLGVQRLGLFGSFVREEQSPESDVDVLVEFLPGRKSYDRFLDLALLLEEILQRRVELVTREALSPYIGPHILDEVQDVPLGA